MSCCDKDCNQGRNCPVRVAKVGRKMHGPEMIIESLWRYQLKRLAYWVLMAILGMLWLAFLVACVAHAN